MRPPLRTRHLLVSASYESRGVIPVSVVRDAVQQMIAGEYADPRQVRTFTSTVFVEPGPSSLVEAWQSLTDEQRGKIYDEMPALFRGIYLTLTGTQPETKACDAVSRNGSCCTLTRPHSFHVGPAGADGRVSSEVWG